MYQAGWKQTWLLQGTDISTEPTVDGNTKDKHTGSRWVELLSFYAGFAWLQNRGRDKFQREILIHCDYLGRETRNLAEKMSLKSLSQARTHPRENLRLLEKSVPWRSMKNRFTNENPLLGEFILVRVYRNKRRRFWR